MVRVEQAYVSVGMAAERMGVSKATLWRWIRRDELTTYRVPGRRETYITVKDMERLTKVIERPQQENRHPDESE